MILRISLTILLLVISILLLIDITRASISLTIIRYLPEYTYLQIAKELQPKSPIIHGLLAQTHEYDQNNINKVFAYEESLKSIALSPNDYRLWLIQAKISEDKQNYIETQNCYKKASQLAPNYFDIFWQWGNFLLRTNQTNEAIVCFKKVLLIKPDYANYIFPLLWETSNGDLDVLDSVLIPDDLVQSILIKTLVSKNSYNHSAELWFKLSQKYKTESQDIAKALVNGLVQTKEYNLAWQVWITLDRNQQIQPIKYQVQNGNFQQAIREDGLWFDWSFNNKEEAKLSRDVGPLKNTYSLKIEYQDPKRSSFEHLKQLILVKPSQKYQLQASLQAFELTNFAPTKIEVFDLSQPNKALNTFSVATGSYKWQPINLVFNTSDQTQAILLVIHRLDDCPKDSPCSIFGSLQISQMSLEEVN